MSRGQIWRWALIELSAPARRTLAAVEPGLLAIGYQEQLMRRDYTFADMFATNKESRTIKLAAFAQEPVSYRSACLGVTVTPQRCFDDPREIALFRSLGAPQIFSINCDTGDVLRWSMPASSPPQVIERFSGEHLGSAILAREAEWGPDTVLRAKSIGRRREYVQLDFFDAGLLPRINEITQLELDRLLRRMIEASVRAAGGRTGAPVDYEGLFRLVFRLLAAKVLADRQHPGPWQEDVPAERVVQAVEDFYFRGARRERLIADVAVQQVAWESLRRGFNFANISVETLAYVYENTLITPETRKRYDVHATPTHVADYAVAHLPIESLGLDERIVFEPFSGHAPFLTAALARLRTLLPANLTAQQRHAYFVRMLSGVEVDAFAREVARNSLILADYPNPDGWQISNADAFTSPVFDQLLTSARVVLCNPPYGDFGASERATLLDGAATNKAVEALRRVLRHPPDMLGFLLPAVFVNGQSYRESRQKLARVYGQVEVVRFSRHLFEHSDVETVLLLAYAKHAEVSSFRTSMVKKNDQQAFLETGQATWQVSAPAGYLRASESPEFWYTPWQSIFDELELAPRLKNIAEIHRGIEFARSLREDSSQLVASAPRPGFQPGLLNTKTGFEPYVAWPTVYLNTEPFNMRHSAPTRQWERPKVIANASRLWSEGWVLAGAIDYDGLVCYQRFHGIWPTCDVPVEVLAALVNSPVANLFANLRRTSRDIQVRVLQELPVPRFTKSQVGRIVSLVMQYVEDRARWRSQPLTSVELEQRCLRSIQLIDAAVLEAYDLSPRGERRLLDFFADRRRPGPVRFERYYPPQFRPAIPWRLYISDDFAKDSAAETLRRMPMINDLAITEAMRELDGADE